MTRRILLAAALIAGCSPSPAATPGTSPSPGATKSPATAASTTPGATATPGGLDSTTSTYTQGTLEVDGAAVTLPTKLTASKLPQGDAIARTYGIGVPAEATVGSWFLVIVYGSQGTARNVQIQLDQKTGPKPQDLLFLSFTRLDDGKGGSPMIVPTGATGTATEHDGVVDITFEGELPGIPTSKHQVKASLPGLPLI